MEGTPKEHRCLQTWSSLLHYGKFASKTTTQTEGKFVDNLGSFLKCTSQ